MKNRLTGKILIILAIPLSFELLLFSSCAFLLHLAQLESTFEHEAVSIIVPADAVLALTMRLACFGLSFSASREEKYRARYLSDRDKLPVRLGELERAASAQPQIQRDLEELRKTTLETNDAIDKAVKTREKLNLSAYVSILESMRDVDLAARQLTTTLLDRRTEMKQQDAALRAFLQHLLMVSLVVSLVVAACGYIVFHRLIFKPLNALSRQTVRFASGQPLEAFPESNDEIGDLHCHFRQTASEIERRRRIEQSIFDNSGDLICMIDANHRFVRVNRSVDRTLGVGVDYLTGKSVSSVLPESEIDNVLSCLERIREGTPVGSFETRLMRANGRAVNVIWSVRWQPEDALYYCTICSVDYERRTAQLSRDLRIAVAQELKEKLISAHEMVDSLLKRKAEDQSLYPGNHLQYLDHSLSKLVRLLSSLDAAMVSDMSAISLKTAPVPSATLIESSAETISHLAKKVKVAISTEADASVVNVDEEQLMRALINLLSNAIKVSPPGGTIRLHAYARDRVVRFEIIDEGPGIPLHQQHLLFERFSQLRSRQSLEGKGSGIGLVSVRTIIEMHGGRIGVQSDGKSGTTFWFDLPVMTS